MSSVAIPNRMSKLTTVPVAIPDKFLVYASAGIPEYWIVNLVTRQVEVYSDPQPNGYATRRDYSHGSSIPLILDGTVVAAVAVVDILP